MFFASTNEQAAEGYLQDRRPATAGSGRSRSSRIALAELRSRDRDQLWAEAAVRLEEQGVGHVLPERLWAAAGEEQAKRMASDSWTELIHRYVNLPERIKDDVSIHEVLCDNQFIAMRADALNRSAEIKAGRILSGMRWERYQARGVATASGSGAIAGRAIDQE